MGNHRFWSFELAPYCRTQTRITQRFTNVSVQILAKGILRNSLISKSELFSKTDRSFYFRRYSDDKTSIVNENLSEALPSQKDAKNAKIMLTTPMLIVLV